MPSKTPTSSHFVSVMSRGSASSALSSDPDTSRHWPPRDPLLPLAAGLLPLLLLPDESMGPQTS